MSGDTLTEILVSTADDLKSALENQSNAGKTIKLSQNLTLNFNQPITIAGINVTLDLNNYKVTINKIDENNSNRFLLSDNSNISIKDGTIVYKMIDGSEKDKSPIRVGNVDKTGISDATANQTLTLTNVNILSNDYGIAVFSKANLSINDGSIVAKSSAISTNGTVPNTGASSYDAVISLSGGNYISTESSALYFPGGKTLTVAGGTLTGKTGFDIRSGTVNITNSAINVTGSPAEKKIEKDGSTPWGMGIAVFDKAGYGSILENKYGNIAVTLSNTTIYNAIYTLYVGDYNAKDGTFDTSNLTGSYDAAIHSISINGIGDSYSSTAGQLANRKVIEGDRSNGSVSTISIDCDLKGNKYIVLNGNNATINGSSSNTTISIDSKNVFGGDLSGWGILGFVNNTADNKTVTITQTGGQVGSIIGAMINQTVSDLKPVDVTINISGGKVASIYGAWHVPGVNNNNLEAPAYLVKELTINVDGGDVGAMQPTFSYGAVGEYDVNILNGIVGELRTGGSNGQIEKINVIIGNDNNSQPSVRYISNIRSIVGQLDLTIKSGSKVDYIAMSTDTEGSTTKNNANTSYIAITDFMKNTMEISNELSDKAYVSLTMDNDVTSSSNGKPYIILGAGVADNINGAPRSADITINAPGHDIIMTKFFVNSEGNPYLDYNVLMKTGASYGTYTSGVYSGDNKVWDDVSKYTISSNFNLEAGNLIIPGNFVKNSDTWCGAGEVTIASNGSFTIAEGATLTLNSEHDRNAKLTATAGTFINNGTIVVNDANGLETAAKIGGIIRIGDSFTIENLDGILTIIGGNSSDNATVLDLNNKTLTINKIERTSNDPSTDSNRIVVDSGYVVIKNGTIKYTGDDSVRDFSPIKVGGGNSAAYVTLTNVSIDSTHEYGVAVFKKGNLAVNGGSIVAGASAVSGNGLESACVITLNGGKYESKNSAAIYFPSTATLTINDATIKGKTGVEVRAGNVTITKSTITADGQTSTAKTEGDGPIAWGMGIAVIDHPSYGKNADGSYSDISVTISGTKVTSNSYDLYVGDLNKNEANTFGGIEGKYVQYHNISISINGKTISSESSEDTNVKDRSYFTSDISSGSSSGGGIPITPPPVVPEPEPIIPDTDGNVTVPALDEKKTEELIHEAVSSGSDSLTIIDTSDVKGDYTAVTVSKSDLETIAKSIENNKNIDSVSIPTSEGNIIIEKEVLSSILENTDADSVSFEVEDAKNKLTEEQKKAVGDRPVYDINIKAGNENVTSFNGKTITVSLPYTLKAGEDPENIVVYYVKDDGSLEKVNCTYKDGKVTFETNHLSKYVIGYEEQDKPVTPDTPDDNKKESSNTIYYAVAAVIIILIIIALAYYFMKKKQ